MGPILQSGHILKVGCGVGDDMKKAAKTCPSFKAFQQVKGIVDLQPLFAQHMQKTGLQVRMDFAAGETDSPHFRRKPNKTSFMPDWRF